MMLVLPVEMLYLSGRRALPPLSRKLQLTRTPVGIKQVAGCQHMAVMVRRSAFREVCHLLSRCPGRFGSSPLSFSGAGWLTAR